jgi:hypothetical protein
MIRLVIAFTAIFISACAHRQEPPQEPSLVAKAMPETSGKKVSDPKRLEEPTEVWQKENHCDKQVLPFLEIKRQYITPTSPLRGQEFEHHFIYVACPSGTQTPIIGTISRKITHKKKLVFENKNDGFEIKSGEWEHVSIIKTPPEIVPGNYKFLLSINIQNTTKFPRPKDFPFKIRK